MAKPRRLLLPVLLMLQALSGCLSIPGGTSQPVASAPGSGSSSQGPAPTSMVSAWRFKPTPQDEPRGVCTASGSAEIYFTTRYGVTVLKPNGASRGYVEARRLDGHRFAIGAPLASPDGGSIFFSDWQQLVYLGLFSLDTGSRDLTKVPFDQDSPIAVDAHIGITAQAALSKDGSRVYLPSGDLYVYDLKTGKRAERHDMGGQARQIARLDDERFLVNLTQEGDVRGSLAMFRASGDTGEIVDYPHPIHAIAARQDWAVGIAKLSDDTFQLVEVQATAGDSLAFKAGPTFALTGDNEALELSLAMRPAKQQVAIGRTGPYPYGETKLVDAKDGAIATADTRDVAGLAFSPDGQALYVAHTLYPTISCLEAFIVP
ncbi:MAG TPA: hypothetical protein V6D00_01080 [Pantanalinema sp.]